MNAAAPKTMQMEDREPSPVFSLCLLTVFSQIRRQKTGDGSPEDRGRFSVFSQISVAAGNS